MIEHISHTKAIKTLTDWHRVLSPGGKLILECPNFDVAVQEYLGGNEDRLLNIFGRQRFYGDAHLYGYNPQRLIRILKEIGFEGIVESHPQSSQALDEPSFRVECKKSLPK
jgi:predicted SAM-dependent methyltransferase